MGSYFLIERKSNGKGSKQMKRWSGEKKPERKSFCFKKQDDCNLIIMIINLIIILLLFSTNHISSGSASHNRISEKWVYPFYEIIIEAF